MAEASVFIFITTMLSTLKISPSAKPLLPEYGSDLVRYDIQQNLRDVSELFTAFPNASNARCLLDPQPRKTWCARWPYELSPEIIVSFLVSDI